MPDITDQYQDYGKKYQYITAYWAVFEAQKYEPNAVDAARTKFVGDMMEKGLDMTVQELWVTMRRDAYK